MKKQVVEERKPYFEEEIGREHCSRRRGSSSGGETQEQEGHSTSVTEVPPGLCGQEEKTSLPVNHPKLKIEQRPTQPLETFPIHGFPRRTWLQPC